MLNSLPHVESTCTDQIVGDILSSWRYDISGLSTEMRTDYELHLAECSHCRTRQQLHRNVDVFLITLTTLSVLAFVLAIAVIRHEETLRTLSLALQVHQMTPGPQPRDHRRHRPPGLHVRLDPGGHRHPRAGLPERHAPPASGVPRAPEARRLNRHQLPTEKPPLAEAFYFHFLNYLSSRSAAEGPAFASEASARPSG